jgi:hypothetical protein
VGRVVVTRVVELFFTAFVYGFTTHVILLGFESSLTRYKGVEPAVFYFFSQAISECIRVAKGLYIRFVSAALQRFRFGARDRDQAQAQEYETEPLNQ